MYGYWFEWGKRQSTPLREYALLVLAKSTSSYDGLSCEIEREREGRAVVHLFFVFPANSCFLVRAEMQSQVSGAKPGTAITEPLEGF